MKGATQSRTLFIILISFVSCVVRAQNYKVSGRVFSSVSKDAISSATIKLLSKDSAVLKITIADTLGYFSFINFNPGIYILKAEALSYFAAQEAIILTVSNNKLFYDSIFLQPSFPDLQGVTITAKRSPVVIKKDTTEFTAASFTSNKNATIEDVFKKIPGIEISKNGSVKAQGETVTQIYVDGKPFFGTDLKAVTQNFPADLIDKIQIIDKKSDQALATKVDDGSYERIINVTLKKNMRKGIFGKETVGYGTDERFAAKANANIFNNEKKISVIAYIDNIAPGDNSASNNMANKQLKFSYANKFGNKFDLSTWAGVNENKKEIEQTTYRKNIFEDSSTNYFETNKTTAISKNIFAGLYFEYRPDSATVIRFNESSGINYNGFTSFTQFNTTSLNDDKINEGKIENNGSSESPFLNGQISYNRKLNAEGRNIFINFSNAINSNSCGSYNNFINDLFSTGTTESLLFNQYTNNNNRNKNIGTTINYTEPISLGNTLNFSYAYNSDDNDIAKEVFDYDTLSASYNLSNDSLNNHFLNNTTSHTTSANYNYNSRKTGFGLGIRWKQSLTQSRLSGKENRYQQNFTGFLPNISFYFGSKNKRLSVYYNSFIQTPQPYQLQPVIDNTNPLYIRSGNPYLKYVIVQMLKYNFKYYNAKKENGFNSSACFSTSANAIGTNIILNNATRQQLSEPVNTNGAYNFTTWLSYFQPLYFGSNKINWNINLTSTRSKLTNIFNGSENVTRSNSARILLGINYDTPEWIDARMNFSFSKQTNKYSLQHNLNSTSYYVTYNPNLVLKPFEFTQIVVEYNYNQTHSNTTNFINASSILNMSINQYFGCKKNVGIALKAYNLLNQINYSWVTYGDNFIQNTRINSLSRFLLFTIDYNIKKSGS